MENASVQRGLFFTFRLFSLIRQGLWPCHLPRRGRLPPGGGAFIGGPALTFKGSLHTRPGLRPVHPLQAGEGWSPSSVTPYGVPPSPWGKATSRRGSVHRGPDLTFRGPLHTRPWLRPVHPLQAGEGWSPSSVRAFGPATFPVGEGCLRRGLRFYGLPPVLVLTGTQPGELFEGPGEVGDVPVAAAVGYLVDLQLALLQ